MFWIVVAVVVVALVAAAWFVSGRQKRRFGNPDSNAGNVGRAKGYSHSMHTNRGPQGPVGPSSF